MHDIGKAIRVAQGKLVEGMDYIFDPLTSRSEHFSYNTAPTEHDIREFLAWMERYPDITIAYDIETNFTRKGKGEDQYEIEAGDLITQIQFSIAPGTGIALPWSSDTLDITRRIMCSPNPKAAHNGWRFDNPIIRAAGIDIVGVNYDTMTMFHHLQPDLPADLQFVGSLYGMPFPWKHYNETNLAFYGIADVDCVQRIMQKLPEDMRKRGVWDSYCEFVRDFQPLLERMQNQGIRIDLDRRAEFKVELETEETKTNDELQTLVPKEIKPFMAYKVWPQDTREFINQFAETNVIVGPKGGRTLPTIKMVGEGSTAGTSIILPDDKRQELIEKFPHYEWRNGSLIRVDEFLPSSVPQIKKLILHYGEKVPLNLDYEESTEAPGLVKLIEKLEKDAEKLDKKRGLPETTTVLAERKRMLANQLTHALTYRKLHKMKSTYVDGWQVGEDGCVHTTFTFRSATWQLTALNPNVQNGPAHGDLAQKFQRIQVASPSRTLLAFDYGGCHLKSLAFEMEDLDYYRMACIDGHSTMAGIALKLIKPEVIFALSDEEWREWAGWFRSDPEREWFRNKQMKPCIAEGELVLTDRGLVPIQAVSLADRLWDGVEWVSHNGIICLGEKEIMEYDGLKATPDHEVYTVCKQRLPFREAASRSLRLERSGDGEQAIRADGCYLSYDQTGSERQWAKRESITTLSMSDLWLQGLDRSSLAEAIGEGWLPEMRRHSQADSALSTTRPALRCNNRPLLQPKMSYLSTLWGAGHRVSIQEPRTFYALGDRESSTQELCWNGIRSDRQQWALRTGELTPGNSGRTNEKHFPECLDVLAGATNSSIGLQQSVHRQLDSQVSSQMGIDGRANYRTSQGCGEGRPQKLANDSAALNRVQVYDILNAGPRHRFTVNGRLVSNCLLGIQLGLMGRKLYSLNQKSFPNEAAAQKLIDLIKSIFPKIPKWQQYIKDLANRQGFLLSRYGGIRWFWSVYRWDAIRGTMVSGEDAEKALAFFVQNNAFGKKRESMLDLARMGLDVKYGMNLDIHDASYFDCPNEYVDEAIPMIKQIMEAPARKLVNKTWPEGLVISVDAKRGPDLGTMEKIKI